MRPHSSENGAMEASKEPISKIQRKSHRLVGETNLRLAVGRGTNSFKDYGSLLSTSVLYG